MKPRIWKARSGFWTIGLGGRSAYYFSTWREAMRFVERYL